MKEKLSFLAVGFVIGILVFLFTNRNSPLPQTKNPAPELPVLSALPALHDEHNESLAKLEASQQKPIKQFKIVPATHAEDSVPKKETEPTHGLRIEEEIVRELEDEKEQLRQHAYAEQRGDGWQIHIVEEDKALTRTGLSDGDIITFDSLNSQFQMADRMRLAGRFTALLRYIER